MHNKIKALLFTVLIIVGSAVFLTACVWYPTFMLNALVIGGGVWATYMLYTSLVTYFEHKDKQK